MSSSAHDFFARLVAETRDTLRRYVRKRVHSDETTEEIMQEAFLRTYERCESVKTPHAFLFSTARNLATDTLRRDHNAPIEAVGDLAGLEVTSGPDGLEAYLLAEESSRILRHAIELLSPQRQAALTLSLFHGHSYKEIGEILGISGRTVERHVAQGVASVRRYVRARYSGGRRG